MRKHKLALVHASAPRAILATASRSLPRAINRVHANSADPAQVIRALQTSVDEFKASHKAELADLRSSVDDLATTNAALRLGGGSASAQGSGRTPNATLHALGSFAVNGSPEAMAGLSPKAAMTTQSSPDGGYLVPEEVDAAISNYQRDVSPMRRLAHVQPVNTDDYSRVFNIGGSASGWVGEQESRPETAGPKLVKLTWPSGEIYANPAVTQRLLDDSFTDIGAFLSEEFAKTFEDQEGAAFINGNGIKKPRGLLTYTVTNEDDAERAFGTLQYVAGGHATLLNNADALVDLVYALKAGYRANAAWTMNSKTIGVVRKLKDGDGNYLWQESARAGQPPTLLGYRVEADENMPDIGAGAYPVAFGDFNSGYMIVDRKGVRILRDPFSNKPYVMFYATKRVGGGLYDSRAIKLLKIAAA